MMGADGHAALIYIYLSHMIQQNRLHIPRWRNNLYDGQNTGQAGFGGVVEIGDECGVPWAFGVADRVVEIGMGGVTGSGSSYGEVCQ